MSSRPNVSSRRGGGALEVGRDARVADELDRPAARVGDRRLRLGAVVEREADDVGARAWRAQSAIAWPMPLEAPVMTAQRPVRSKGDGGHGVAGSSTSGLPTLPAPGSSNAIAHVARLEQLRDRRSEHELEGAPARRRGRAVAGRAGSRPARRAAGRARSPPGRTGRRVVEPRSCAQPRTAGSGRCAMPRPRACGSTHIEISCTSSGLTRTNAPTTPSHCVVLVGDEERLLVAVRRLADPVAPRPVRLPHHVVVAGREEVGVVAQHPQPRLAPAPPLVGPGGPDRDRSALVRVRGARSSR